MGCPIVVKMEDGKVTSVTGNTCPRGEEYARKEVTDPTRIVTTTVRVADGKVPMINVKTEHDIPKDKIFVVGTHPLSHDSKYFGFVDKSQIIRKATPLF
jgi:CxxC motif-containing protein